MHDAELLRAFERSRLVRHDAKRLPLRKLAEASQTSP
jgi:hypothetical protein